MPDTTTRGASYRGVQVGDRLRHTETGRTHTVTRIDPNDPTMPFLMDNGIWWCEQTPGGWRSHEIDASISQTHALHLADINGDGLTDFVTGKRFWAHNGHDPGSYEPAELCWFERKRTAGRPEWTKRQIDVESGVGLHCRVVDVDGDGLLDIVTSNKKGVHYFRQVRR